MEGKHYYKLPDVLSEDEQKILLRSFDKRYFTGYRNYLMVRIGLQVGLRTAEAISLKWSDIDRSTYKIYANGGGTINARFITLADEKTFKMLNDYLEKFPQYLNLSGLVFPNKKGQEMKPDYLRSMLPRKATKAGIKKPVSYHLLRHTFLKKFLKENNDIVALKEVSGLSNLTDLAPYRRMVNIELEEAIKKHANL